MTPEDRDIVRILKAFREIGGVWWKTPRSRFTKSGMPDIVGCFYGYFLAYEVKRLDGVGGYGATAIQKRTMDIINSVGRGVAGLISNEEQFEDAKTTLRAIRHIEDPSWRAS